MDNKNKIEAKIAVILFATLLATISCQHQSHQEEHAPYAGQQKRQIKALSGNQLRGYREGRGMGMAKVAELNHYPGPMHILELNDKLNLTANQREQVKKAFNQMKKRAQELGEQVIAKEKQLDEIFAGGKASKPKVKALLHEIGKLKADLRFTHIQAHINMKNVLKSRQIQEYDSLRGYGKNGKKHRKHNHHHSN